MRFTFRRAVRAALFALSVAVVGLAAPRGALAGPPLDATTRDYDQLHLIIKVTPDIAAGTVDGEVMVGFTPLGGPLSVLRLHSLETTVLSATDVAGRLLPFALADGILSITLAEPLPVDRSSAVTVRYRSKPTAGLFFHAPTKASPSTPLEMYSQGEGRENRRWFPCYDESDDRTTCEVYVTMPPGLRSVGNGVLVERKALDGGRTTDHWRLDHRIPSYLVSLVVGTFETVTDTWRDVPLEYNGPPGRTDEIRKGYAGTPAMMEFFTEYTGRKFPWPRYAQTTVWDFVYGGMENAGATTMNMRLLHLPEACPCYSSDGLVAHELAHQWFGDLLTCRTFDHMWLNEGFATYFTDLFFEHRDGPAAFSLERWNQNRGYMNGTPRPDTLGLVAAPRGDLPLELHGGKEYSRGAAILHQLRIELGDEVFRAGIRRYVKDHEDETVSSDDFRRSMEAEAGRSLAWFFDQWVYGAGYPVLKASWNVEGAGTPSRVRVTIEQTQAGGGGQPDAFRLSVPWRMGTVTGRFDVRRRRQEFAIDVPDAKGAWLRLGDGGGTFARAETNQPWPAFVAQLDGDDDPTAQLEAVDALGAWPTRDTAMALARRFGDAKTLPQVRAAVVRGLAPMTGADDVVAGLLDRAVADADPRVREAAAEVLGGRTRDQAGAAVGKLLADPSPYVRAAAARALGKLHVDGAFDTLRGLLVQDSHRETVRAGALDGLAALGDRRALEVAVPFLAYEFPRGDHHGMRQAALNLFVALAPDEPEIHARILALLDDTYHRMRMWAAEAAGKLLVRKAQPRLEAMAANDPDGGAKGAAKTALERLAADAKKKP